MIFSPVANFGNHPLCLSEKKKEKKIGITTDLSYKSPQMEKLVKFGL